MKSNELRVGNFIKDRGGNILRIDWLEKNKICQQMWTESKTMELHPLTLSFEYCQPIPLTEEWLLKFGVTSTELNPAKNGIWITSEIDKQGSWIHISHGMGTVTVNVHYVHQLQNLYFALTGEELTLK